MSTSYVASLRSVLVVLALGALALQTVVVPLVARDLAGTYPEVEYLATPYTVAVIVALVGFEVALLAVWRLLTLGGQGDVRSSSSKPWVDLLGFSVSFGALVMAGICVHAGFVADVGGPATLLGTVASLALAVVSVLSRNAVESRLVRDHGSVDALVH